MLTKLYCKYIYNMLKKQKKDKRIFNFLLSNKYLLFDFFI